MREAVSTVLDALAALLIVAGVALVYVPAAFVVAGVAVLAVSYRLAPSEPTPKADE